MTLEMLPFSDQEPEYKDLSDVVLERARTLQKEIGLAALLASEIGQMYNAKVQEILENRQQMRELGISVDENEYYRNAPRISEGQRLAGRAIIERVISEGIPEIAPSEPDSLTKSHLHIVD